MKQTENRGSDSIPAFPLDPLPRFLRLPLCPPVPFPSLSLHLSHLYSLSLSAANDVSTVASSVKCKAFSVYYCSISQPGGGIRKHALISQHATTVMNSVRRPKAAFSCGIEPWLCFRTRAVLLSSLLGVTIKNGNAAHPADKLPPGLQTGRAWSLPIL